MLEMVTGNGTGIKSKVTFKMWGLKNRAKIFPSMCNACSGILLEYLLKAYLAVYGLSAYVVGYPL